MLKELLKQANGDLRVSEGREKAQAGDFKGQVIDVVDYETMQIVDEFTGELKTLGVIATESHWFMVGDNFKGKVDKLEQLVGRKFTDILKEENIEVSITEKTSKRNGRKYLDFKFV